MQYHRDAFTRTSTLEELIDFAFDVHAPGRILQMPEANIANWMTSHAIFMTSVDRVWGYTRFPSTKTVIPKSPTLDEQRLARTGFFPLGGGGPTPVLKESVPGERTSDLGIRYGGKQ